MQKHSSRTNKQKTAINTSTVSALPFHLGNTFKIILKILTILLYNSKYNTTINTEW